MRILLHFEQTHGILSPGNVQGAQRLLARLIAGGRRLNARRTVCGHFNRSAASREGDLLGDFVLPEWQYAWSKKD